MMQLSVIHLSDGRGFFLIRPNLGGMALFQSNIFDETRFELTTAHLRAKPGPRFTPISRPT